MYSTDATTTPSVLRRPERRRSGGFSLMELLVAMMIMAILGVVAYKQFNKEGGKARHIRAMDACMSVGKGLDQYYLRYGTYPELNGWAAMVADEGPLVKGDFIQKGMAPKDPWDQDYEASSTKAGYSIKCAGDPNNQAAAGPIVLVPGRAPIVGGSTDTAAPGTIPTTPTTTPAPQETPK